MASDGRTPVGIDADVEFLAEQLEALKALGAKDSVDDGDVYDFSIRWGAGLAGRLPRLVHYDSLGLLDQADRQRFQRLCAELRAVSDVAGKLGLPRPVLPGEKAATASGHRHFKMRSRLPKRRSRS